MSHAESLNFESTPIEISYDDNGLPQIHTGDDNAYAYAQGYLHGKDRCIQITLLQAIMRSKLGAWFESNDETLALDKHFSILSMYYQARKEESQLDGDDRKFLKSYTEGLNQGRRSHWPKSLSLLKVPMETWTMADSLALLKVMGYIGLASSQKEAEKFIAQSLHADVSPEYISSIFNVVFTQKDYDILEFIKKVNFDQTLIPQSKFFKAIPTLKNSNNWVIGKSRSKTGAPIMAFDPHLEINRFPAIWYETSATIKKRQTIGISMPGIPGIIMGRNKDLAYSFTYGFMDTIDYFIEEVKREEVIEADGLTSGLIKRKEFIERKNGSTIEVNLFETQRGILEVPESALSKMGNLEDGLYLSRAWSGHQQGSAQAIGLLRQIFHTKDVTSACNLTKDLFISCNWLFCDSEGNLAQQQSGFLPERADADSGLLPRLAQRSDGHWKRVHSPERLYQCINPPDDFLVTANNEIPALDDHDNVNLPMGSYRKDRISNLIKENDKWEVEQMKSLQGDIYSLQAKAYLEIISPFIPDTPNGRMLKQWECRFDKDDQAPYLYSKFIEIAYEMLFSPAIGEQAWSYLYEQTALVADYYANFDRIILEPQERDKVWYHSYKGETLLEKRDDFLQKALKKSLSRAPKNRMKTWGEENHFYFTHILFGDKFKNTPILKKLFNRGPYHLRGDKTTVCQGNRFKSGGRDSTFAPSYRMITTMNSPIVFTAIPGGAHESVFKAHWFNESKRYLNLQYKTIKMEES